MHIDRFKARLGKACCHFRLTIDTLLAEDCDSWLIFTTVQIWRLDLLIEIEVWRSDKTFMISIGNQVILLLYAFWIITAAGDLIADLTPLLLQLRTLKLRLYRLDKRRLIMSYLPQGFVREDAIIAGVIHPPAPQSGDVLR